MSAGKKLVNIMQQARDAGIYAAATQAINELPRWRDYYNNQSVYRCNQCGQEVPEWLDDNGAGARVALEMACGYVPEDTPEAEEDAYGPLLTRTIRYF